MQQQNFAQPGYNPSVNAGDIEGKTAMPDPNIAHGMPV